MFIIRFCFISTSREIKYLDIRNKVKTYIIHSRCKLILLSKHCTIYKFQFFHLLFTSFYVYLTVVSSLIILLAFALKEAYQWCLSCKIWTLMQKAKIHTHIHTDTHTYMPMNRKPCECIEVQLIGSLGT